MLVNTHKEFHAGVFIGGKDGVIEEFNTFTIFHHPRAVCLPLATTGGAAKFLFETNTDHILKDSKLATCTDYQELFNTLL